MRPFKASNTSTGVPFSSVFTGLRLMAVSYICALLESTPLRGSAVAVGGGVIVGVLVGRGVNVGIGVTVGRGVIVGRSVGVGAGWPGSALMRSCASASRSTPLRIVAPT